MFTEQGVAILSSALHSEGVIQVNIQVMRTFTREMLSTHEELARKLIVMDKTGAIIFSKAT